MLKIKNFKKKSVKKTAKKQSPVEEDKNNLTLKSEIFCQAWVDCIGNGTQAALAAFDITGKEIIDEGPKKGKTGFVTVKSKEEWKEKVRKVQNVAASVAKEYLRKPHILKRIDEIVAERGFNDAFAQREHFKLMAQDKDLSSKMRALSDYYKLKGKYAPEVVEITARRQIQEVMGKLKNSL